MKTSILGVIAGAAIAFYTLGASGAEPSATPPSVPPAPVCNPPADAAVALNVKNGEVEVLMAYLNNQQDVLPLGRIRALAISVQSQINALKAKYCK